MTATVPVFHPQLNDQGKRVRLHTPSKPDGMERLAHANQTATFVPGEIVNGVLNGVPLATWAKVPATLADWNHCINPSLGEPPLQVPEGKQAAAGTVVIEPDGRLWLVAPSNRFGGYKATFPKGRAEASMALQATAIKETYEESGLATAILAFIGDFSRTQTYTRFYLARRIGGMPADMGWESQAVHLVPQQQARRWLNRSTDHSVLAVALERIVQDALLSRLRCALFHF